MTLALSLNSFGQKGRKTFTDTIFQVGDVLEAPAIFFGCTWGPGMFNHVDSTAKQIADFLIKHPTFKIEIACHSDTRGDTKANYLITQSKADDCKQELVEKYKIKPDKIVAKGYGETQPLISDKTIKSAKTKEEKEALHNKNMRTNVKILALSLIHI